MIDVLVALCLRDDPGACATRAVPVGRETCEAALEAAAPRIASWRGNYAIGEVSCGALPPSTLAFEEVAPGVHVHVAAIALAEAANGGDIGNVAFVVGPDGVAVIDAGGTRAMGEAVVAAVRAATDQPIRAVVLTHAHPDHVFGATALQDAGAEVVAHARLPEALGARAESYMEQARRQIGAAFLGSEPPVPDRLVADLDALDLGGRSLDLRAFPVAHSDADLVALDQETGTLLAGDLVFDRHIPTIDGSLAGWLDALDALATIPAAHVVPGHGGPLLPWPAGAGPERRYLETLREDLRALIVRGAPIAEAAGEAAASEAGAWLLFDEHNPRNATTAYTELEWE